MFAVMIIAPRVKRMIPVLTIAHQFRHAAMVYVMALRPMPLAWLIAQPHQAAVMMMTMVGEAVEVEVEEADGCHHHRRHRCVRTIGHARSGPHA